MGLIQSFSDWFKPKAAVAGDATSDVWYAPASAISGTVEGDNALKISVVYACVSLLSDAVGSLPLKVYRKTKDGKQEVPDHPVANIIASPNETQTTFEFIQLLMTSLLLYGNVYHEKKADQLLFLHPEKIKVEIADSGRLVLIYTDKDGAQRKITQNKLFRVHGMGVDGVTGLNPIAYQRETLEAGKDSQQYGKACFTNGVYPSGILKVPQNVTMTQEAADVLEKKFAAKHAGAANHKKPIVLREGIEFTQMSLSPVDMQYIENKKFNVGDIARIFRVPPHLIGDLDRATFNNIEHLSIQYVTHTIRPWLIRIEQAIKRDLILEPDVFVEFKVDGLLRGDTKSRFEAYSMARNGGWMSVNDIRTLENLDPIDNGDVYLEPLNMKEAGSAPSEATNAPSP